MSWPVRVAIACVLLCGCRRAPRELEESPRPRMSAAATVTAAADYAGSERCRPCHEQAYSGWLRSQHRHAMQLPSEETVLGDFESRELMRAGERTQLVRDQQGYAVEASGLWHEAGQARAVRQRFPVKYTFGVSPLQQYLLDTGDGHLQAATLAWDSRPREQGGARWFALQPEERGRTGDELHWSSPAYNWNTSCADCHSTDLRKRYDASRGAYETTFSEMSVGCEACHGPGARHVGLATAGGLAAGSGFARDFERHSQRTWQLAPGEPIASLAPGSRRTVEVEACAFCHSHRSDLGSDSLELHDRYRVDLLDQELFYPDGQQRQETFEVNSFWQSKMFAAGVVCSDCHEPHQGKLRRPGNALCTGCHDAQRYDAPSHHLHPAPGVAGECVTCHMPTRTFMQIDARREHRLSVPRPDLTLELGVPNACTEACHAERRRESDAAAARWAATTISQHFGPQRPSSFAPALALGRARAAAGAVELVSLALSTESSIARATALTELASYPEVRLRRLAALARDASPLVRRALAQLAGHHSAPERALVVPLLHDSARAVRLEAARALFDAPPALSSDGEREALARALIELRASLEHNSDRAGALLELARLEGGTDTASRSRAEALYRRALALEPGFAATYLNFADFLRAHRREDEALATLEHGLSQCHDRAPLEHALGLAWVRRGDRARGLQHLQRAYRAAPGSTQLGYVYAVALFDSSQRARAIAVLEALAQQAPGDRAVAQLLATYRAERGPRRGEEQRPKPAPAPLRAAD